MGVVQDLIFGQTRWELPFAILIGEMGICPSSGISDGMAGQVMEPNSDTPFEKASASISAGLEASGRARVDLLFMQPWGRSIELQTGCEGSEGFFTVMGRTKGLRSWSDVCQRR